MSFSYLYYRSCDYDTPLACCLGVRTVGQCGGEGRASVLRRASEFLACHLTCLSWPLHRQLTVGFRTNGGSPSVEICDKAREDHTASTRDKYLACLPRRRVLQHALPQKTRWLLLGRDAPTGATTALLFPLCLALTWPLHRYLGPAESISMETAARTDRRSTSAMAAAVKAAAEGRRGRRWEGRGGDDGGQNGVNPDEFEPLLYAQLALTSPSVEPDDCRCSLSLEWDVGGRGGSEWDHAHGCVPCTVFFRRRGPACLGRV